MSVRRHLLARIVRLDGLRLNDHARVSFLPVLALGGYRPRHVARTQTESRSQRRQCRDEHRDNNLNDLSLCHTSPPFISLSGAARRKTPAPATKGRLSWFSYHPADPSVPRRPCYPH